MSAYGEATGERTADGVVDLRSDTLTRPTQEMRRAMAEAEVGDDVYAEDPTVRALEEEVAGRFGKAAALYVPSGTMGNQIAVRLLVPPSAELLLDADAHLVSYEGGGAAQHGGIQTRTIVSPRGLLDVEEVHRQIRPDGFGTVVTRAVAVEQTHNRGGGAVYPLAQLAALRDVAWAHGARLHCDGARIWNAYVATGVALADYGALFDTMSVCLSKGLGAPVGSLVVVSDEEAAAEARVVRRRLGGGMRQAGVIAAAGLYALRHHVERLADDHARARMLATRIAAAAPVVDPALVETNIVALDLSAVSVDAVTLARQCAAAGVRISVVGSHRVRLVTHLDVDDAGCDKAADVVCRLLSTA